MENNTGVAINVMRDENQSPPGYFVRVGFVDLETNEKHLYDFDPDSCERFGELLIETAKNARLIDPYEYRRR